MKTWAIYCDTAAMMYDAVDEGDDPQGAIGSNWQPGYTKEQAEAFCEECRREGWTRGHDRHPRF